MSATLQRDRAGKLAKTNPQKALDQARAIDQPWFRAQSLSWAVRFTDADPIPIAAEAARAAAECDDDYKRSAVRAWEIAALAERSLFPQARESLYAALAHAKLATPASSRSEALILLLQAAMKISPADAKKVYALLAVSCPPDEHWRCKRALRDAAKIISGELQPRQFYW